MTSFMNDPLSFFVFESLVWRFFPDNSHWRHLDFLMSSIFFTSLTSWIDQNKNIKKMKIFLIFHMTDINLFPTDWKRQCYIRRGSRILWQNTMYYSTTAPVIKSVTIGVGGQNMLNIAWRHLWTTPTNNHVKGFFLVTVIFRNQTEN